jgi:23S rRNA (cytosine1962-C5)-methyltransferase
MSSKLSQSSVHSLIHAALARRSALLAQPAIEAIRLFHGSVDGLDGLVIEKLGPVIVVQAHEGRLKISLEELRPAVDALRDQVGAKAAYLKHFIRDRGQVADDLDAAHRDPTPWIGQPVEPEITVRENELRFIIHPYDGFSVGLFLEHRDNRRRVHALAKGKRVLNLFAYTCGFSVAAVAGGAKSVSSVDISRRYLEWGKANFVCNGLDTTGHWFFCSDTFDFFKRAGRQGKTYDLIVLDPPTFSKTRRPQRVFVLQDDLARLVRGAVQLLAPAGVILLSVNDRDLGAAHMERVLQEAVPGRRCRIVERPPLPTDFANDADYSKSLIARYE